MTTTLAALLMACAPLVHPVTAQALIAVESGGNPWAIGVVGGALEHQPHSRTQALATLRSLRAGGWDFSVGLAQINMRNFERLGISVEESLEPCVNLRSMQVVLGECYARAARRESTEQAALHAALSCYYSGNFRTGFDHGYVARVVAAAAAAPKAGAARESDPVVRSF